MASQYPTPERLRRILQRQDRPKFGPEYQPAIRATPKEAPSVSRPSVGYSPLLCRDMHFLSLQERFAAMLAIHHPRLDELHEQKMISVDPRPHPMFGHARAAGLELAPVRGSVDVAERLGCLAIHPTVWIEIPESSGQRICVPFPYIGDLLLFMWDELGPYCINWTIKMRQEDFTCSQSSVVRKRKPEADEYKAWARHEIERVYYADCGIQTVRIASETDIDKNVSANLTHLFCWNAHPLEIHPDQRAEMLRLYERALAQGIPPLDIFGQIMMRYHCSDSDAKAVLYQAIWARRLRVDLFRPILPNRPLRPEQCDVLEFYGKWFRRQPCM